MGCALDRTMSMDGLAHVQEGRVPGEDAMPSFSAIQEAVGFPGYYAEAGRYTMHEPMGTSAASSPSGQAAEEHAEAAPSADKEITVEFGAADANGAPSDATNTVSTDRCRAIADKARCDHLQVPCWDTAVPTIT